MTYLLQSVDAEPALVELHRNGYETVAALRTSFLRQRATELNLLHKTDTMETPHLRLFRKQDIELVIHEMASEGHHVEPLNMWPGGGPLDAYVDLPPFSAPHPKLLLGNFVSTSIGITITKAA